MYTTTLYIFYGTHNIPCPGIPGACPIICWDCPLSCAAALVRGAMTSCLPLRDTPKLGVGGIDNFCTSVFLKKILRYYYIPTI